MPPRQATRMAAIAALALMLTLVANKPFVQFANGQTSASQAEAKKMPIPDAPALKNAQKLINDVYGADIAKAKTPEEKIALAKKLLQTATQTKNDPAGQYALLCNSRDLASGACDIDGAFAAIAQLEQYDVDGLKVKLEALTSASKSARAAQDAKAFLGQVNPIIDEAIGGDRYDMAVQLATLVSAVGKAAKDPEVIKAGAARSREVRDTQDAYTQAKKAFETLAAKPQDPEANLAAGRFTCFMKGDWRKGLPMLALGCDSLLRGLAEKEAVVPSVPEKQAELADGWWDAAAREKGLAQRHVHQHAAGLYEKAMPTLSGIVKAKAEKHIADTALEAKIENRQTLSELRSQFSKDLTIDFEGLNFGAIAYSGFFPPPGPNVADELEVKRLQSEFVIWGTNKHGIVKFNGTEYAHIGKLVVLKNCRPPSALAALAFTVVTKDDQVPIDAYLYVVGIKGDADAKGGVPPPKYITLGFQQNTTYNVSFKLEDGKLGVLCNGKSIGDIDLGGKGRVGIGATTRYQGDRIELTIKPSLNE